ncbi:MAG TPA: sulfotransferase [Thermoanaerobaculia bacterium]
MRFLRFARRRKVFGIGLPKTGTKTLGDCFRQLGLKNRSFDMRLAALAKKNQLDEVLAEAEKYETFEDWPWFFLYRELDRRFPNSQFVLTLRKDTDAYVASLKKHHERQGIRRKDFVPPDWWNDVFGFPPDQWDYEKSALRYEQHNREVLEYFKNRPDDLLVVCWERGDGWDSLCPFLNKRIPRRPFPHLNRADRGTP